MEKLCLLGFSQPTIFIPVLFWSTVNDDLIHAGTLVPATQITYIDML
jgi:hypothetical protein